MDVLVLRYSLALGLATVAVLTVPLAYLPYAAAAAVVAAGPVSESVRFSSPHSCSVHQRVVLLGMLAKLCLG